MISKREKQLAVQLREYLDLPAGISDSDILTETKGTFIRARIELNMAWADFFNEIKNEIELLFPGKLR